MLSIPYRQSGTPSRSSSVTTPYAIHCSVGSTPKHPPSEHDHGGGFETSLRCTSPVSAITHRMSTQGKASGPLTPGGSRYVAGIGRTLPASGGSGRTGAGQSSFRLSGVQASAPTGWLESPGETGHSLAFGRSVDVGVGEGLGGGVASASSGGGHSEMPGAISFMRSRAQM